MDVDGLNGAFASAGVTFEEFHGFPAARLSGEFGGALVSLYGGHVVEYTLPDSEPVLWMSGKSLFAAGSPLRGGVPVCFPWFGPAPEGKSGSHGFVRTAMWDVAAAGMAPAGGVFVTLNFRSEPFELFYTVTLGRMLTLSLEIENHSAEEFRFGGALHTYFNVSDAERIAVEGLDGLSYLDKVIGGGGIQRGTLVIDREIDRIFDGCGSVRIVDPGFRREILIDKSGSDSTVVWNPWIDKSKRMADFGDDEYHTMVCVEAARVPAAGDEGIVPPGASVELRQVIRVSPLP